MLVQCGGVKGGLPPYKGGLLDGNCNNLENIISDLNRDDEYSDR